MPICLWTVSKKSQKTQNNDNLCLAQKKLMHDNFFEKFAAPNSNKIDSRVPEISKRQTYMQISIMCILPQYSKWACSQ